MGIAEKTWNDFWQSAAWQRKPEAELSRRVGDELRSLFADVAPRRVLEIGCANGVLFAPLGFAAAEHYRGVDIVGHALADFERRHPGVATTCASGHEYVDDSQYDLIFSNGTVQYFDPPMLDRLFANAARMLAPDGRFVCASIPWRHLQLAWIRGQLRRGPLQGNRRRSLPVGLALLLRMRLFGGGIGCWYDIPFFEKLAAKHRLSGEFFGSLTSLNGFHAVFRRVEASPADG